MRFSFPLALLCLLCFARLASADHPQPSPDRLTRAAQMIYAPGFFVSDIDDGKAWQQRRDKIQRVARTALNEVAPSTLHRHFEVQLQKVRYGSWEESSMAYVLAMRGFEPLHNARRLTHNWNQQDTTDDFYDTDLGVTLAKIYRAHPSDELMRLFLIQRGDAHAAETIAFERQEMLLRFPRAVLRVAAGNTAIINRLASDLTYENSAATPIARRIDATLKAAARRSSEREATAARYLLRRIKQERIGEP